MLLLPEYAGKLKMTSNESVLIKNKITSILTTFWISATATLWITKLVGVLNIEIWLLFVLWLIGSLLCVVISIILCFEVQDV